MHTIIKVVKSEDYADIQDSRIIDKRKKYASDKQRTIALRIANNKDALDASFKVKDRKLSFTCLRFKVSKVEHLYVIVDVEYTQRMLNASLREELTACINKDIAVMLDVHDVKTAIRETCTLRHSICFALYHITHNKKFLLFASDKKQTEVKNVARPAKSSNKKSIVKAIAKVAVAKKAVKK